MTEVFSHVNWVAVLVADVAHFFLGGIWFMGLFGRHYAAALGIADRPRQTPGPVFLVGPFVCSTVTIATTAFLLRALAIRTYTDALALGMMVGIGYLAAMTVNRCDQSAFPTPLLLLPHQHANVHHRQPDDSQDPGGHGVTMSPTCCSCSGDGGYQERLFLMMPMT